MTRIATVAESQKIDELSHDHELLMESAGALAAREIRSEFALELHGSFIAIVCGPGGNGADGLVCARHLASAGLTVRVYLADESSKHELFRKQLKRLVGVPRASFDVVHEIASASLIVDALFGLGLRRTVKGLSKGAIDEMNQAPAPTVSIDVPSGLDADRGVALGSAVKAQMTLTFGLAKQGFFVSDGPSHVGRLRVIPIGFPIETVRSVANSVSAFGLRSARRLLPSRDSSSNKSSAGRVTLFAGQDGFTGASVLSGLGAMRSGAGYVTLVTDASPVEISKIAPEFLTMKLSDEKLWDKAKGSAVVVGPGFGVGERSLKILRGLHANAFDSVVVDADALTTIAQNLGTSSAKSRVQLRSSWILTPHAGELARLIGGQAREHEANRFDACARAARELGAIVLFKGFRTVVSDGKRSVVIRSGNSALAKAGTGDILSGIIAGFLAQKMDPFEAACLSAYVHGRVADEWLKSGRDVLSMQPSDIAQILPVLLRKIRS